MLPALVVNGNDRSRLQQPAELYGVVGGHRVPDGARDREAHAAEVDEGRADGEAVGDPAHAAKENGVARDPEDAMLLAAPADRESNNGAGQGLKNIRQRAASIAGAASVSSRPGRGTTVEIALRA